LIHRRQTAVRTALLLGLSTSLWADPSMNTGGQLGVSRTLSTYTMGEGSTNIGLSAKADVAYNDIHLQMSNKTEQKQTAYLFGQDVFVGIGLTNWLDLSMDMPFYQDVWENHTNRSVGTGDLSIALKAEHPGLYREAPFRTGYYLRASLPTGMSSAGYMQRHSYNTREGTSYSGAYTVQAFALSPMMLWTLDFSKFPGRVPLQLHANAGGYLQLQAAEDSGTRRQHTSLVASVAAEYKLDSISSGFLELSGETKAENLIDGFDIVNDWNRDVLRLSVGGKFQLRSGLNGSLALDLGLSDPNRNSTWSRLNDNNVREKYTVSNTPTFGVTLTLGYGSKGAKAKPFMGRFFAQEDTLLVIRRDTVTRRDTVKVIKNDTVLIVKRDTIKVVETQNPKTIIQYGVMVFRSVNFNANSAELTAGSFPALNDVAQSLVNYPEVSLEVRGYTDNKGGNDVNRRLSQERAEAVVDYLVKKGVAPNRLKPVGMGAADPVADNSTVEGRTLNRRVEIRRTDAPK